MSFIYLLDTKRCVCNFSALHKEGEFNFFFPKSLNSVVNNFLIFWGGTIKLSKRLELSRHQSLAHFSLPILYLVILASLIVHSTLTKHSRKDMIVIVS